MSKSEYLCVKIFMFVQTSLCPTVWRRWLGAFVSLEKINQMEVPVMSEAINAYHTITASPEYREMERLREKARHGEASALRTAKMEGREEKAIEIAQRLLKRSRPVDEIMEDTGLTYEEIEKLRTSLYPS